MAFGAIDGPVIILGLYSGGVCAGLGVIFGAGSFGIDFGAIDGPEPVTRAELLALSGADFVVTCLFKYPVLLSVGVVAAPPLELPDPVILTFLFGSIGETFFGVLELFIDPIQGGSITTTFGGTLKPCIAP